MEDKIFYIENLRKKTFKLFIITLSISISIALISVYILSICTGMFQTGLFILVFSGVISFFLLSYMTGYNKSHKEYKAEYKKVFVELPFHEAFDQVSCDLEKGISKDTIEATGIMMLGNRYYTNDYIRGTYKDVNFERADIKIQNHTSNGKTSNTVTYFHGRWLIFEFNKKFHFDLQIIGKGFGFSKTKSGFFTSNDNRRSKIELEDINFNQEFKVYAQDDHEAFYILTPQFMNTLKDMSNTIDGDLMLGFVDNKLHVAINTGNDAMEPSIFNDETNHNHIEAQKEINIIKTIIDELDLDREIYN